MLKGFTRFQPPCYNPGFPRLPRRGSDPGPGSSGSPRVPPELPPQHGSRVRLKAQERVREISSHIEKKERELVQALEEYPHDILDLVIFHKICFYLPPPEAQASFGRLKTSFVDWNEVRISPIPEIQEAIGAPDHSLSLAVFIKDLLDFLHHEKHTVSLESLVEENISDIRRFLKKIKGVEASTINLALRQRKDYPMIPVDPRMERALERLGVVKASETCDQKGKSLHEHLEPEPGLHFHHFILAHSRDICPPEDELVQCGVCGLKASCPDYQNRSKKKKKKKASPAKKAGAKKTAAKKTAAKKTRKKVARKS